MDLYYLNCSEFAHSDRLLRSLWLIILKLGLHLTNAGRGKLLTKIGERYNKNQLLVKDFAVLCLHTQLLKSCEVVPRKRVLRI